MDPVRKVMDPVNPYEPIALGIDGQGKPIRYDYVNAMNPHAAILGQSGAGKTFVVKKLVREYIARGITVMILDTQGDLVDAQDWLPDSMVNRQRFQYGGRGTASLNPMKINLDERYGGAIQAVEDTVEAFSIMKRQMGDMQETTLRKLVTRCYEKHGISVDDQTTWHKRCPDWNDLYDTAMLMLDGEPIVDEDGEDDGAEGAEGAEGGEAVAAEGAPAATTNEPAVKAEGAQKAAVSISVEKAAATLKIKTQEVSVPKDEAKRLAGLAGTIKAALDTGLFRADNLEIKRGKVNIIDVSTLRHKHRQVLIRLLLERVFGYSVRSCPRDQMNQKVPRTMVVLDEAKYAAAAGRGQFTPLNRIATEGRKFGLGMLLGVQTAKHLSEEQQLNCAMALMLPLVPLARADGAKFMGCSESLLEKLVPRQDGIFRFNSDGARIVHLRGD